MDKYIGLLISTNDTQNHTRFSEEVLKELVARQEQVPVLLNFQGMPIGSTEKMELDDSGLLCSFNIQNILIRPEELYVVPRMIVKSEDVIEDEHGVRVITKGKLLDVSISITPADPTLTPIKKKD
jgi:hypothetical protein